MRKIISLILLLLSACSTGNSGLYYDDRGQITPPDADSLERSDEVKSNSGYLQNFISAELAYRREDFDRAFYYLNKIKDYPEQTPTIALRLSELGLLLNQPKAGLSITENSLNHTPSESKFDILAMLYVANGDDKSAIKTLQHKLKTFPSAKNTKAQLAYLYVLNEQSDLAAELLNKPETFAELSISGYLSEQTGDLLKAEQYYRRAAEKEGSQDILPALVRVLALQNNRQAIKDLIASKSSFLPELDKLKQFIENDNLSLIAEDLPPYSEFLVEQNYINFQIQLAVEDTARKDVEAALIRILALTHYFPKISTARFVAFTAYRDLNRPWSATAVLKDISEDDPLRTRALILIALTLRAEREYQAAEPYILEAMDLNPEKETVFALYLLNLKGQKKVSEAEKAVRDFLEDQPDNEYYIFEHATLLFELKKFDDSHALLKQIIERNPAHSGALNFLAYTYAESGKNLELALEYVNKSIDIEPMNPAYLDTKAWIYFKQGRFAEAAVIQGSAVKLLPEDPVLSEHYGDILNALGQTDSAQDWYRQALIQGKDAEPSLEIEKLLERLKEKVK